MQLADSSFIHSRVQVLTDAPVHFGLIPAEDWYQPTWIDEEEATSRRKFMEEVGIIYGGEDKNCSVLCVVEV